MNSTPLAFRQEVHTFEQERRHYRSEVLAERF